MTRNALVLLLVLALAAPAGADLCTANVGGSPVACKIRKPEHPRFRLGREALLSATDLVVHGTTTADNTMIEMSGATSGLITSEGHRDEIEIRRGYKEDIWDPALPPPPPICPRRRRYGVPERLDFEGHVIVPLDEEAVRRACRRMQRQGVDSLAVVLLFSFVNPAHERRVREIAAEELPRVMVS